MNTVPVPVGKFTAYPDSVSCHSVSKHRPCAPGRFVVTFVLSAHSAGLSHHRSMVSYSELGPPLKISRLASTLIRHNPPNRVHRRSRMTPCITDWQFASSCSPRSACAAAVTFRYRPVDFGLTGTLTPLRHRLHSRTSQTRQCLDCNTPPFPIRPEGTRDGFTTTIIHKFRRPFRTERLCRNLTKPDTGVSG